MDQLNSAPRSTTADSKFLTVFWRSLSPTGNTGDAIFRVLLLAAAVLMILIVGSMIVALAWKSLPSIRQFGFGFFNLV